MTCLYGESDLPSAAPWLGQHACTHCPALPLKLPPPIAFAQLKGMGVLGVIAELDGRYLPLPHACALVMLDCLSAAEAARMAVPNGPSMRLCYQPAVFIPQTAIVASHNGAREMTPPL